MNSQKLNRTWQVLETTMIVFYRIHLIYYKTTYVYKYLTHSYKYLYEKFKKENIRNYSEFCKTIKSMRLMHIHEPTEQWS